MKTLGNKITLNLSDDAEVIVKGFIAPIEYTQYNFHVDWDELANFRVAEPKKQYPTSVFQAFLPSEPVSVSEPWEIQEEGTLTLLKQLHPNPRLKLTIDSGDSRGLWGCLRAYNDELAEIVFRIHAEFIMKSGKFTPSQFAGHLLIDRHQESVVSFKIYVPPTTINFDAGWTRDEGTAVEIGFCPKIELSAGTPTHDVEFTASITEEEAGRALSSHFYEFQKINWVSLEEALEMAPTQGKPIHVISVDGPLFDEAC
ncbi:hypothetical protein C6497_06195 [Candidatus Poribacteria bacterium]|nr:MAG: hypothetical protein C6497_06195 [Candidatus Poribacteria bacterium]